jgi:hypothetical protein
MVALYCELTDLPVASCAHCRGITGEPDRPDPADFGPWFAARLAGWCAGCKTRVSAGDRIRADGQARYMCEACGAPA